MYFKSEINYNRCFSGCLGGPALICGLTWLNSHFMADTKWPIISNIQKIIINSNSILCSIFFYLFLKYYPPGDLIHFGSLALLVSDFRPSVERFLSAILDKYLTLSWLTSQNQALMLPLSLSVILKIQHVLVSNTRHPGPNRLNWI